MADLIDVIHQEVARVMARQPGIKAATVSSYDPARHSIKATIQPDGYETGWFPIGTQHIGNGWGVLSGPQIGDQVVVGFLGGDVESPVHLGRIHSDQEQPPNAKTGELILRDKNGTQMKFDGTGLTTTVGGATIHVGLDGAITIGSGGAQIALNGPLAITGDTLTHNGVNIGHDHQHTLVVVGTEQSGPPAS